MILNLVIKEVHCLSNSELVYRNIKHAPGASQLHSPWKALRKAYQGKYTYDLLLFLLLPFLLWTSSTNELVQNRIYLHLGLTRLENILFYNWIIAQQPYSLSKVKNNLSQQGVSGGNNITFCQSFIPGMNFGIRVNLSFLR